MPTAAEVRAELQAATSELALALDRHAEKVGGLPFGHPLYRTYLDLNGALVRYLLLLDAALDLEE